VLPWVVSPLAPPPRLTLSLTPCLTAAAAVRCTSSNASLVRPVPPQWSLPSSCSPGATSATTTITVYAPLRRDVASAPPAAATLSCAVVDAGGGLLAWTSLPVQVDGWALSWLADVVVIEPPRVDSSSGVGDAAAASLVSMRSGAAVLQLDAIDVSANDSVCVQSAADWLNDTSSPVPAAAATCAAMDRALVTAAVSGSAAARSVQVSTAVHLAVVGTAALPAGTVVMVGSVVCRTLWRSADDTVLHVLTPAWSAVCPAGGQGDCGYHTLTVVAPPPAAGGVRAANVSCPPYCPGAYMEEVPLPVGTSGALLPSRSRAAVADDDGALPVALDVDTAAGGLYYMETCAGFTDPRSGVCTNASEPSARACAYGSRDTCTACPAGALCPGGSRLWPLPGYWVSNERAGVGAVVGCDVPATARCTGWDASAGQSGCGAAYAAGGYRCLACAPAYYPALDGTCASCPAAADAWAEARPILIFLGALAGVAVALYAGLVAVAWCVGGTLRGGAARMVQFASWSVAVMQVVAQVGQAATPNLPAVARTAYAAVNIFQLEGVALPAACSPSYAFLAPVTIMSLALALLAVGAAAAVPLPAGVRWCGWLRAPAGRPLAPAGKPRASAPPPRAPRATRLRAIVTRVTFTLVVLLFPLVINDALRLLVCHPATITVRTYAALNGDGRALAGAVTATANDLLTVSLMESNPTFVCYEGQHRAAAAVAVVALVVVGVVFPVASAVWVRLRMAALLRQGGRWEEYVAGAGADAATAVALRRISCSATAAAAACGVRRAARWWRVRAPGAPPAPRRQAVVLATVTGAKAPAASAAAAPRAAPGAAAAAVVDHNAAIAGDPALAPFTASHYRASQYTFRHLDLAALIVLSLVLVVWARPASGHEVWAKAGVIVVVAASLLWLLWTRQPYAVGATWKLFVRSVALVLTALAAVTNAVAADAGSEGPPPAALAAQAWAMALGCVFLGVTLVAAFGVDAV